MCSALLIIEIYTPLKFHVQSVIVFEIQPQQVSDGRKKGRTSGRTDERTAKSIYLHCGGGQQLKTYTCLYADLNKYGEEEIAAQVADTFGRRLLVIGVLCYLLKFFG